MTTYTADSPLHIAIVVKEFPPHRIGGLETQTFRIARELHNREDCEVTVYTKSYERDIDYQTGFLNPEFNVVRVPNLITSPGRAISFKILVFLYLLRDAKRYDVIQCMQIQPYGFIGYILNQLYGVPYFAWIRGGPYYYGIKRTIDRFMIRRIINDTLVLVQSEKVRDDVLSTFPDADLEVIKNGVDLPNERAKGDKIVYVGRLVEEKGVGDLIRALEDLDEQLLVVGNGPYRDRLELMAAERGIEAEFVGEVAPEEVTKYLLRGKVFVLPSLHAEGSPNVVLEAMAAGLPVIATKSGGTAGIVKDEETGYLVEPGSAEELRDRIKRLASNPDARERMSMQARRYVSENHTWEIVTNDLVKVYKRLTGEYSPNSHNTS